MMDDLARRVLAGDRRALARVMTLLERDDPTGTAVWQALYPSTGNAHRIGLTGPPGAGKSTLVNQLARHYRRRSETAGIVAVDPTSALTGGALLGDRVRMGQLALDPGVFVRSMASRGQPGGLAAQTAAVADVLDAAGMDLVLVETVGVGQDALTIVGEAHTTVLVGAPGQGDEVQAMKAGLLELADVLVVNQADRDGAPALADAWRWAVEDGSHSEREPGWRPPVVETAATTGQGLPELVAAIDQHRAWLADGGAWEQRTKRIAGERILWALAHHLLMTVRRRATGNGNWDQLIADVAARRLDPVAAAERLADVALDSRLPTDPAG
ncbi:MAG: methylmalonyl Co-A mutase-associated GTPase MeaB [Dehalococcoidia bacterium]|nr:methylmalonyl Co-A mutase-associated GTPase MeaB [Dehalococcoidia bacterium]